MPKFFKEHWILVLSLFLLFLMSVPLLYFGNILRSLDRHSGGVDRMRLNLPCQVGICLNNLLERRWDIERHQWLAAARKRGVAVQIRVAHNSLARQIRQIRGLIRQKARVLLLAPVAQKGLEAVLQEAKRAGLKIILYDEWTAGPADFYCGPDYRKIGRIQAKALFRRAGAGKYVQFQGPADSFKTTRIVQGQLEGLPMTHRPAVEVLTVTLPDGSAETAALRTRSLLAHQKFVAVLAPNELVSAEVRRLWAGQEQTAVWLAEMGPEPLGRQRQETSVRRLIVVIDYARLAQAAWDIAGRWLAGAKVESPNMLEVGTRKLPAWLLSGSVERLN
ncbi:MAG: substrate-binding domain-containing protein [Bacillota bacterium]